MGSYWLRTGGYTIVADARRVHAKIKQLLGDDMPVDFKYVRRATSSSHQSRAPIRLSTMMIKPAYNNEMYNNNIIDTLPFDPFALCVLRSRSSRGRVSQQASRKKKQVYSLVSHSQFELVNQLVANELTMIISQ